jgi:hypothetical protein
MTRWFTEGKKGRKWFLSVHVRAEFILTGESGFKYNCGSSKTPDLEPVQLLLL